MITAACIALVVALGALYYIRQDCGKYVEVERVVLEMVLDDLREATTDLTALNPDLYGILVTDLLRDITLLEEILGVDYDR